MRVTLPPPKPLLIFDGDCHFCRRWIERWREQTATAVEYRPSQSVAFPEIPAEQFQKSVVLVLPDGEVQTGAAAVYRSLAFAPKRRWPLSLYRRSPLFARVSELGYREVARHRTLASFFSRLLWGDDVRAPTYTITRDVFLRLLGLVYFIAFVSLWIQVDGLVGERGILPAGEFLSAVREHYGMRAYFYLPTLCWFDSSSGMLHFLCASGAVAALALIVGLVPLATLLWCFVSYLSLTTAGQDFLSFQWDILLLEAGFLALFWGPWHWRLPPRGGEGVSRVGRFLLTALLFKLMFMSGVVKLTSGDDCWWKLTALDYHYWTQPLPTPIAWFFNLHAEWFKKFSVAFCLVVEIIVPFFLWSPRRGRLLAAGLLVFLQIAIAATGNYGFFNLLTVALCLLPIDDATWGQIFRRRRGGATAIVAVPPSHVVAWVALVVALPINLWLCYRSLRREARIPSALAPIYRNIEQFRIVNGYGLFRVMTRERPDIEIEGSADGTEWKRYDFKYKAGDVNKAPPWVAPHQPRLDWQMWFAALGSVRNEIWFQRFALRLLENEPRVTKLLARNPFPESPPRYLRARLYQYEFTNGAERHRDGAWWKRREIGEYLPQVGRDDFAGAP